MALVYLGLGANLGDAQQTLRQAIDALAQEAKLSLYGISSLYRTQPIKAEGPDYYNCAVALDTQLSPRALLALCQTIEADFGRQRPYKNAPRTLDIDILLYDALSVNEEDLVIPHPRLTERAFVLVPLIELNLSIEIPQLGRADLFLTAVAEQRIEKVDDDLKSLTASFNKQKT